VLVAVILGLAAPAAAQSPSTPVSSDGTMGMPFPIKGEGHFAASSRGTGNPDELTGAPVSEYELDLIAALRPATAGVGIESLLGADTRQRVLIGFDGGYDYPARATVLVTFTGGYCSGALVGPHTVLTAGHCVHTGKGGSWRTNVQVWPGYNDGVAPYGSYAAVNLASVVGWTNSGLEAYDYGAIKLGSNVGSTVGYYGFYRPTSFTLPTIIQGYPGDLENPSSGAQRQWLSADRVWVTSTYQLFYKNDTAGGMSGSAVWHDYISTCAPCVFGVHAYGIHGTSPHSLYNHGVKFTLSVYNNYNYWRNTW
jgi:glutamyl endopeptidase